MPTAGDGAPFQSRRTAFAFGRRPTVSEPGDYISQYIADCAGQLAELRIAYGRLDFPNSRPWRDLPSFPLAASSLVALIVAMALPFSPIGAWFGFETPPTPVLVGISAIVIAYLVSAEVLKSLAVKPQPRTRRTLAMTNLCSSRRNRQILKGAQAGCADS